MLGHALCHALSFRSETIPHSITNNAIDKEYNLVDFKQLIRSGNNTIRMNCGWTYCPGDRSRSPTLLGSTQKNRGDKSHRVIIA